jgi:hypothetical protein
MTPRIISRIHLFKFLSVGDVRTSRTSLRMSGQSMPYKKHRSLYVSAHTHSERRLTYCFRRREKSCNNQSVLPAGRAGPACGRKKRRESCRRVVQMISLVNYEDCVSFTEGESRWHFRCSLEVTAV